MRVLRKIIFGKTEKNHIFVNNKSVFIGISYFRNSNVRIADKDGNHLYKPRENIISNDCFVEWMITNTEIALLLKEFFTEKEIDEIIKKINQVKEYINQQGDYIGRKIVSDENNIKSFKIFKIIPRFEKFFTFKKSIENSGSFVEVTFKPGDVSPMEEHMYMLIPFDKLEFILNGEKLNEGDCIGIPCFAVWKPNKTEIEEIVTTIAYTSEKHKTQLIGEINRFKS